CRCLRWQERSGRARQLSRCQCHSWELIWIAVAIRLQCLWCSGDSLIAVFSPNACEYRLMFDGHTEQSSEFTRIHLRLTSVPWRHTIPVMARSEGSFLARRGFLKGAAVSAATGAAALVAPVTPSDAQAPNAQAAPADQILAQQRDGRAAVPG